MRAMSDDRAVDGDLASERGLCEPLSGVATRRPFAGKPLMRGCYAAMALLNLYIAYRLEWGWETLPIGATVALLAWFVLHPPGFPPVDLELALPAAGRCCVLAHDATAAGAILDVLRNHGHEARELDGSRIRSASDLADALDAAFGAFGEPRDPVARIVAHIAHERRGTGAKALLWRDANTMRTTDRPTFDRFVADWAGAMATNGSARLLFVDLGRKATTHAT